MALRSPLVMGSDGLSQQLQAGDSLPVPAFGQFGVLSGIKLWIGETTTDSSGARSVNLATAGFTIAPKVFPQALSTATTLSASATAILTARSASAASGFVNLPATIVVGGLGDTRAGAGITVMVMAIGA